MKRLFYFFVLAMFCASAAGFRSVFSRAAAIKNKSITSSASQNSISISTSRATSLALHNMLGMSGGSTPSSSSRVHHLSTSESFRSLLANSGDKLVVVDFSASWCMPCRMIAPEFDKLSVTAPFTNAVVFAKVDVDELSDVAAAQGVNAMPTFVFYKNNKEVQRFSGASKDKIQQTIRSLIKE